MTPCEQLGYKVGDTFRVVVPAELANVTDIVGFEVGQIVTLYEDDTTAIPLFSGENKRYMLAGDGPGAYLDLDYVCKVEV